MAITPVITETTEAVPGGLETQFTAAGAFTLTGDYFRSDEKAELQRLGPSGDYVTVTDQMGPVIVTECPNTVYVETPGQYRVLKSATRSAAAVGIQSPYTLELLIDTDEYPELKLTEFFGTTTGIWYDPQDLTTMFQNAAGTLPVYRPGSGAVDPPVGLLLDKSQGLELGPELWDGVLSVEDGGSPSSAGEYVPATGELKNNAAGQYNYRPLFAGTPIDKGFYLVSVAFSGNVGVLFGIGLARAYDVAVFENASVRGSDIRNNGNTYTYIGYAGSTTRHLSILCDGRTTWDGLFIDSISIREIKGYHAYQSTTTARPTLSGRYSLLLGTATLATQSVTTVATNYTLRFEGTGTITLSGTATGTYTAGTHTITCTAGTLTCTVAGTVTKADLRVKRDGSALPAYQAVTSATVYDTAGFPLYLKRDKVDDDLICQVPVGGITGAWAHGTIDGPAIGAVAIPAGEYHPFGTGLTNGLPDCTQWIAIDGTLSASEQAVFERYVYSKARQLISVDQFGGSHSFERFFLGRGDIVALDTSSWDTRNVSSILSMFDTTFISTLDVSGWDTSKVIGFGYFLNAANITSIDVSGFDTSNATRLDSFIKGTKAQVIDVSNFNTSKVTNCYYALNGNTELLALDISGWDTSKVTGNPGDYSGFRSFVSSCVKLATVLVGNAFDNTPCTNFQSAFINTNLNQESIDAILVSINTAGTSNGVFDQSGGSAPSATGQAAITAMRSRGWTVTVTGGF